MQNGPYASHYDNGLFSDVVYVGDFKLYYDLQFEGLLRAVETWPGFEREVEKIALWEKNIFGKAVQALKGVAKDFSVLNHGGKSGRALKSS